MTIKRFYQYWILIGIFLFHSFGITQFKQKQLRNDWLDSDTSLNLAEQISKNVEHRFLNSKAFKEHQPIKKGENILVYHANPQFAKIRMHMSSLTLWEVLESGEILNQHDTKYSGGGGYAPDDRLDLEETLSGFKFNSTIRKDSRLNKILPKYGIVEFHDFANDPYVQEFWELKSSREVSGQYGEIAVYLKDHVKRRTTVFPSDTGNGFHGRVEDLGQSLNQKEVLIIGGQAYWGEFFEAELWGPLTLNDIEKIVIPKVYYKSFPLKFKKILAESLIPVYEEVPNDRQTDKQRLLEDFRILPIGKALINRSLNLKSVQCRKLFM